MCYLKGVIFFQCQQISSPELKHVNAAALLPWKNGWLRQMMYAKPFLSRRAYLH